MFAEDVTQFGSDFIRAVVTEEGSCSPEIFYIGLLKRLYLILPESRVLLGFYCRTSIVYNITLSILILTLRFSSHLSEEKQLALGSIIA